MLTFCRFSVTFSKNLLLDATTMSGGIRRAINQSTLIPITSDNSVPTRLFCLFPYKFEANNDGVYVGMETVVGMVPSIEGLIMHAIIARTVGP